MLFVHWMPFIWTCTPLTWVTLTWALLSSPALHWGAWILPTGDAISWSLKPLMLTISDNLYFAFFSFFSYVIMEIRKEKITLKNSLTYFFWKKRTKVKTFALSTWANSNTFVNCTSLNLNKIVKKFKRIITNLSFFIFPMKCLF